MGIPCSTSQTALRVSQEVINDRENNLPIDTVIPQRNQLRDSGQQRSQKNSQQIQNYEQKISELDQLFKQVFNQLQVLTNEISMIKQRIQIDIKEYQTGDNLVNDNQLLDFQQAQFYNEVKIQMDIKKLYETIQIYGEQIKELKQDTQVLKIDEQQIIKNVIQYCDNTMSFCDDLCVQNTNQINQLVHKQKLNNLANSILQYSQKINQGDKNLQEQIDQNKKNIESIQAKLSNYEKIINYLPPNTINKIIQ